MAPIAAEMCSDPVRPGAFANRGRCYRIGLGVFWIRHGRQPRLPQRGDVINVNSEAQISHWPKSEQKFPDCHPERGTSQPESVFANLREIPRSEADWRFSLPGSSRWRPSSASCAESGVHGGIASSDIRPTGYLGDLEVASPS